MLNVEGAKYLWLKLILKSGIDFVQENRIRERHGRIQRINHVEPQSREAWWLLKSGQPIDMPAGIRKSFKAARVFRTAE